MSISLTHLHTFKFTYSANNLVDIESTAQLKSLIVNGMQAPLILGGGSNLIFTGNYDGHVLRNRLKGIDVVQESDSFIIRVASGENWHQLVEYLIRKNISGLENLALIPGTVGGAPIQNIGAYGVEFEDICLSVTGVHLETGEDITFTNEQCKFDYRESIFKREFSGNFFITEVTLKLSKLWSPSLHYGPLQYLKGNDVQPLDVFREVCRTRQSKLPNVEQIGNAGSFFKNPVITKEHLDALLKEFPSMPFYAYKNNQFKLAAGWLIDKCGLKGYSVGDLQVYEKQALVLINRGQGNANDLLALARQIQDRVYNKFNVRLSPEVRFYQGDSEWFPL